MSSADEKPWSPKRIGRRRAWDRAAFPWHMGMAPETIELDGETLTHPAQTSAVFVVHGIGMQTLTETAALLRSGFDDALAALAADREQEIREAGAARKAGREPRYGIEGIAQDAYVPPPFLYEGYWANYGDLKATFPADWQRFDAESRGLYENLWRRRLLSVGQTIRWYARQQLRLLGKTPFPSWAWFTYLAMQVPLFLVWAVALVRHPKLVWGFLSDVRIYLEPRGVTERAIVQRIDWRVGARFLQMLGLDWEFRPLPDEALIDASGRRVTFSRIVWVAHSLGTVISYNVLSDLFCRAAEIERGAGDAEQKEGVRKFRAGLRRFVTMGSPLDKAAFLFPDRVSPWPDRPRPELLDCDGEGDAGEWWVNYYQILDPVSGALDNPHVCKRGAPLNLHTGYIPWPFSAHTAYWSHEEPLRFILTRTYGKKILRDHVPKAWASWKLTLLAFMAHLALDVLLLAVTVGVIWLLFKPEWLLRLARWVV